MKSLRLYTNSYFSGIVYASRDFVTVPLELGSDSENRELESAILLAFNRRDFRFELFGHVFDLVFI